MTDQTTEITPIEAEEIELPEAKTQRIPVPAQPQRARREQGEFEKEVRMKITSMIPVPIQVWSKSAIAAFVLGLLVFWTLGFTAIPAIVLGHIGIVRTRSRERGRWLAVIGLICGYATVGLFTLAMLGGLLYYFNS